MPLHLPPGRSIDPRTSVYYTLVDRDLTIDRIFGDPISVDQMRVSLTVHALFYDHLVIPDRASIYNPALRALSLDPDHQQYGFEQLLKTGIVIWARRSNTGTFRELHEFMANTNSWKVEESKRNLEFLEFLDDTCKSRAEYDYNRTGSLFTQLTNTCLTNSSLMGELGLGSIATAAYEYSERRRRFLNDQYSRRTAIYDFAATLDRKGASRKARHLRQLSSVLYHGSAAHDLGLQLAYPGQYRDALNVLHRTTLPGRRSEVASLNSALLNATRVQDLEFYSQALALLNSPVIGDIRKSKDFRVYLKALRRANEGTDSKVVDDFSEALLHYIDYLNIPLGAVLTDRYARWQKRQQQAKLARYVNRAGSGCVALVGAIEPQLGIAGLIMSAVWGFGGMQLTSWLEKKIIKEEIGARSASTTPPPVTITTSKLRNLK